MLFINTYYLQVLCHDMYLELILMNEVAHWFFQLDYMTFPKNLFQSVNFALSFCQILYVQIVNFMDCLIFAIFAKTLHTL